MATTDDRFDVLDGIAAMLCERGKIVAVRLKGTDEVVAWWSEVEEIAEEPHKAAEVGYTCETCNGQGKVIRDHLYEVECSDCENGIRWEGRY